MPGNGDERRQPDVNEGTRADACLISIRREGRLHIDHRTDFSPGPIPTTMPMPPVMMNTDGPCQNEARTRGAFRLHLLLGACLLIPIVLAQGCASPQKQHVPAVQPATDPLEAAKAAYRAGDYGRAASLLSSLAHQNVPEAQYALGYMHYFGQGIPRNREVAEYWIERAAAQGYAKAEIARKQLGAQHTPQPDVADAVHGGETAVAKDDVQAREVVSNTLPPEPLPSAADAPEPAAEPIAVPPAEPATAPETLPDAPQPVAEQRVDEAVRGVDWLRSRAPDHYTIQLVAGAREKDIIRYIRQNNIADKATYFQDHGHDRPWFCVVYGDFPDFRKAQQALTELAAKLRGASPWIRRFRSIQKTLATPEPPAAATAGQ